VSQNFLLFRPTNAQQIY